MKKEIKEYNQLFVGKKWSDAYDCGSGAELNCVILILERAIKEKWDLFKLRDYLKERRVKIARDWYKKLLDKVKEKEYEK